MPKNGVKLDQIEANFCIKILPKIATNIVQNFKFSLSQK